MERGCCIISLWLRNFLKSSYSIRTLRSWSKKIPALGIHVIKAYTEFQQYPCIIFEDMSILLSAIFIFHSLILLLVTEISEQPRYIFANISGLGEYFSKRIFALKHWVQAGRFEYHEPYIQNNYNYYKESVLFRGFCYKQQNQTMKNENGTQ